MNGALAQTWYGALKMPSVARQSNEGAQNAQRFAAMFDAHHDSVWRTLRRLGVNEAEVDDATQRVFLVAVKKLDAIRAGEEGAFLYGVALRTASEVRRRAPERREVKSDAALELLADDAPGPEEQLLRGEALEMLDEVLGGLPDSLREVLVLVELEGVAAPKVAELLGVPLGTAASRLRRAREAFSESARRVRARLVGGGR